MNKEAFPKENLIFRTVVTFAAIVLAAALRIVPHPWNLAPVGAMALFSGAMVRDRRLTFVFPLLALFAGDVFIGFHKLMPVQFSPQRPHRPLVAKSPHADPRRRRNPSWRHSVFHRHKFWRLGARELLSPNLGWSRRLLRGRDSLLLEHSRRRRSLCNPVVRRLRPRRTIHSCAACAQPVRFYVVF